MSGIEYRISGAELHPSTLYSKFYLLHSKFVVSLDDTSYH